MALFICYTSLHTMYNMLVHAFVAGAALFSLPYLSCTPSPHTYTSPLMDFVGLVSHTHIYGLLLLAFWFEFSNAYRFLRLPTPIPKRRQDTAVWQSVRIPSSSMLTGRDVTKYGFGRRYRKCHALIALTLTAGADCMPAASPFIIPPHSGSGFRIIPPPHCHKPGTSPAAGYRYLFSTVYTATYTSTLLPSTPAPAAHSATTLSLFAKRPSLSFLLLAHAL